MDSSQQLRCGVYACSLKERGVVISRTEVSVYPTLVCLLFSFVVCILLCNLFYS